MAKSITPAQLFMLSDLIEDGAIEMQWVEGAEKRVLNNLIAKGWVRLRGRFYQATADGKKWFKEYIE
jgi:DNA-binding PadR family transcriptional regulator